jgi:hypothetical protein
MKGKVIRKADDDYDGEPSVSVDWYKDKNPDDFLAGRVLFSTDNVMNAQYRFLKEDLDWVKGISDIPIPKVGDKFMWGAWKKHQRPITIINVDDTYETYDDIDIEFQYDGERTDAYMYDDWVSDWKDGVIRPMVNEDLDWIKSVPFKITDDYIKNLMSNCEDIPVTNYNLRTNSPYLRRGKMNVFYYSMCPFWWDKVKDEPRDEDGRGKGEWLQSSWHTPENSVAVVMPDRNGVTNLRDMDNDEFSVIAYDLKGLSKHFNATGGELHLFLDDDGNPRYDLVPEHLVNEVKKGFEGVEMSRTLEESNEFEWVEEIPEDIDWDLWEKIADDIDNHVSGPHSGDMRGLFGDLTDDLTEVLDTYNIDITDMGDFFDYPDNPRDVDGNYITNYQLQDLHKDLIEIGVSLTPKQEREMNESEFDWVNDAPDLDGHRFFDVYVCGDTQYDEETGEDECLDGGSYFLKIPREEVEGIWNLDVGDMGGVGDEGLGVIEWAVRNDKMDYGDMIEYVLELDRDEYCRVWGNYQTEDKGLCHKSINESDFDWAKEHQPWEPGGKYAIDFTTEDEDVGGYLGFNERKRRGQMLDVLTKLGYDTTNTALDMCIYFLEDTITNDDRKWRILESGCTSEDLNYSYGAINDEGYELLTPTEFFDVTRGSI